MESPNRKYGNRIISSDEQLYYIDMIWAIVFILGHMTLYRNLDK
jgi:hypothetical protein